MLTVSSVKTGGSVILSAAKNHYPQVSSPEWLTKRSPSSTGIFHRVILRSAQNDKLPWFHSTVLASIVTTIVLGLRKDPMQEPVRILLCLPTVCSRPQAPHQPSAPASAPLSPPRPCYRRVGGLSSSAGRCRGPSPPVRQGCRSGRP